MTQHPAFAGCVLEIAILISKLETAYPLSTNPRIYMEFEIWTSRSSRIVRLPCLRDNESATRREPTMADQMALPLSMKAVEHGSVEII